MGLSTETKQTVISNFGRAGGDTGSPQVQIALLTERLKQLNEHFKTNHKDHHSRRGLLKLVGRRRKLLRYLNNRDPEGYKKLISDLGIRG